MKAVIYARYSTENQDAASLEGQERVCRAHADRLGHDVVTVYTDAAISGTTLARPGLQRLIADARAKRFRAVIVTDLSRLSRDRLDGGNLVRQLADLGVRVLDVKTQTDSDDESADVVHAIEGIVSQEYVKAVRAATHRQLQTRALDGFNPGGKAYGYTSIEEPSPKDARNPRRLSVIDQAEALVVRRVFEMALAGNSPREIAHQLNQDGVGAPHDGGRGFKGARGWSHTTIRSMLQARRYIGEVTWNAYRWKKTARGTRRRVPRPASEHVVKSYPELAIIDANTFDRVVAKYTARKTGPVKARVMKSRHVLAGLLTCGVCNGTFGVVHTRKVDGKTIRTLGCMPAKDRGDAVCSNRKTIADSKVIHAIAKGLRLRMSDPDRVAKFVAAFQAKFERLEAAGADPRAAITTKLDKARQIIANVTEALVNAPSSRALNERLAVEERGLEELERQLGELQRQRPKVIPHPAAIAAYVAKLADVLESGDMASTGDILRAALAPFAMHPQADGYRLSGAINLGLSDQKSSGGVI